MYRSMVAVKCQPCRVSPVWGISAFAETRHGDETEWVRGQWSGNAERIRSTSSYSAKFGSTNSRQTYSTVKQKQSANSSHRSNFARSLILLPLGSPFITNTEGWEGEDPLIFRVNYAASSLLTRYFVTLRRRPISALVIPLLRQRLARSAGVSITHMTKTIRQRMGRRIQKRVFIFGKAILGEGAAPSPPYPHILPPSSGLCNPLPRSVREP